MNEYERVNMIEDKRWTNTLKCDIMENITKLGDAEQRNRLAEMDVSLLNENKFLHDIKKNIGKYYEQFKEVNGDFKDMILSGTGNRILLERYRPLFPDKIKLSMNHSIHTTNNVTNSRLKQVNNALNKLEIMRKHVNPQKEKQQLNIKTKKMKATMGKVVNKVKRIALVDLTQRRTKKMVDVVKQNLIKYDTVIEQLQNDARTMALNIMKEIETGTNFNEDTANYIKSYFAEKDAKEKCINKHKSHLDKLNSIIDSMEHSRKTLLKNKMATKIEKQFYSKLPWTATDTVDDELVKNAIAENEKKNDNNNWCSNISQFGIMHFVLQEDQTTFLNNLKNNINVSSIDYKFPENIFDYITLSDTQPTNDELAADYVLKKTEYNNIGDLVKNVESTKNDLMKLNKLTTLRTTLRNLLFNDRLYKKETVAKLKLLTKKDIEFIKQTEIFKTFIDEQNIKISKVEKIKSHYLKLFNNLYFYMDNIKSILKKLNVSLDGTKQLSFTKMNVTSQDSILDTSTEESVILIKEVKSMIIEIDGKFRWCNLIIPDEFDAKQLNFARAMYVFKVQEYIQEDLMKKKIKFAILSKKNDTSDMPKKSEEILSRDDMKKQAELFVKMFNEKETDVSKNKRKPISFRRSFI